MTEQTRLQFNDIKQRFALMKNGVVSDALTAMNLPHRIIWGLNLPQIKEIASAYEPQTDLARALWADTATRESVLLAPWLMPPDEVDADTAMRLIDEAPTLEAVDMLCHALLRHQPYAVALTDTLATAEQPMRRYAAMRLLARQLQVDTHRARALAQAELDRQDSLTRIPAANIIDDIDFIEGK